MTEYILVGLYAAMGLLLVEIGFFKDIRSGKSENPGGMLIFIITIMSLLFWPLIVIYALTMKEDI